MTEEQAKALRREDPKKFWARVRAEYRRNTRSVRNIAVLDHRGGDPPVCEKTQMGRPRRATGYARSDPRSAGRRPIAAVRSRSRCSRRKRSNCGAR